MRKLQKLLNHTFGILPLDRFNEKDFEILEDMNIDSEEDSEEDEDYDISPEEIIIDIQDEIVEKFSKKMENNKDFLDFFLGVEGKSIYDGKSKGKKGMSDEDAFEKHNYDQMCKQINKSELKKEDKEKLKKEYKKIQDYAKTLLPDDLKILKLDLPIEVKFEIFEKLEALNNSMGAHDDNKTRDWVNSVMKIPFGKYCDKPKIEDLGKFLSEFKNNLDKAIYGQTKVKETLMEITTKWLMTNSDKGHCIAIEGPPGVGKTSLIRDGLSKALNRPFCSFSLAGISDENYLSGFSFTYEGATCGRFSRMLMETKCMNPIIFLDELDKVDVKRSLSVFNKLIELTDFSQNHEIEDYYFGGNIKLDLSKCIFIFSLNDINNVDPILKDRLEVIKVDGFDNKEKLVIAKNYLVPIELKNYNFQVIFSDENLRYIINKLNDEKGVRNLKRVIEIIMRKINVLRFYNQKKLSYFIKDFKIINDKLVMNNKMIDKLLKDTGDKINPIILRMYS
jgi:ATP-dependent Lon protease